jgi:hypothetical protein
MILPSNDPSFNMDLNPDLRLSLPMSLDHRVSEQPPLGMDRDDPMGLVRPPTDPFDEAIVGRPGSQLPQRPDTAERNRPVPPHLFDALDQAMDAAAELPGGTPSAFVAQPALPTVGGAAGAALPSAAAQGQQQQPPQLFGAATGTVRLLPGSGMIPVVGLGGGSAPGRGDGYSSSGNPGAGAGGDGWQDIDNLITAWDPSNTNQAPDVLRGALMRDPSHSMRDLRMHLSRWSSAPPGWGNTGTGLPASNNGSRLGPQGPAAVGASVASHTGAVYGAPQGAFGPLQHQGMQQATPSAVGGGAEPLHLMQARNMVASMPQGPDTDFYLDRLLAMPVVEEAQELSFGGAPPGLHQGLQPPAAHQATARQRPPQYFGHPTAGASGQGMHPGSVPSVAQSLGAPPATGQNMQQGAGVSDSHSHGSAPPQALLMTYPFHQQLAEVVQQPQQQAPWQQQVGMKASPARGVYSAPVAFAMQPEVPPNQAGPFGAQHGPVLQRAPHGSGHGSGPFSDPVHPLARAGSTNDPMTGSGDLSSALPSVPGLAAASAAHAHAHVHGITRMAPAQHTRLQQGMAGDATFSYPQQAAGPQPANYFQLNPALQHSGSLSTAAAGGQGSSSDRDRPGSGGVTVTQGPYPTGPASGGVTGVSQQASGGGQTIPQNVLPHNVPPQGDAASLVGGGGHGALDHLSASLARLGRAGSPHDGTGGTGPNTATTTAVAASPGPAQPYQMSSAVSRLSIKVRTGMVGVGCHIGRGCSGKAEHQGVDCCPCCRRFQ